MKSFFLISYHHSSCSNKRKYVIVSKEFYFSPHRIQLHVCVCDSYAAAAASAPMVAWCCRRSNDKDHENEEAQNKNKHQENKRK